MDGATGIMSEGPLVSVIIPTKNAAKNIGDCLRSIARSTYRNFEIIVVDGLSTDGTAEIARSLGARVIQGTARGRAADCNLGIAEAQGDIVAFTDDDCMVDERWLERLVSCFADPRVGIAGGPDLTYTQGATAVELAAGHIHYFYRSLASKTGADAVIGCNSAYRRQALLDAGGFDDGLPGAEDTPLHARILRLGYTVKVDSRCIVYHKRRATSRALLRKYWRYGWEMGWSHRRNPGAFKERRKHIYPLIGGLLALPVLALLGVKYPWIWWLFLGLLIAYLLFLAVLHSYLQRKTGFKSLFPAFLLFSTLCMLIYGVGFAKEQVIPRKRG
jgi:glycosyltransferase involved in cell wall biosynthesis